MWSLYYYCMLVLSVMTARQWIWHWKWMCIRTKVKTFFMGTKLKISILKLLWECFLWFTKLLCINTCKMLLHDKPRCSCLSFMMISVFVYFFVPWFLIFEVNIVWLLSGSIGYFFKRWTSRKWGMSFSLIPPFFLCTMISFIRHICCQFMLLCTWHHASCMVAVPLYVIRSSAITHWVEHWYKQEKSNKRS